MHINIAKINFKPIGINIAKVDFGLYDVANYQDEYLTLPVFEAGEIPINIQDMVDQTYATSISYSKDKSNWTETVVDNTAQTITIPVYNGDNVYLKGKAEQWSTNNSSFNISSDCNIIASGNIMSLLYGDDFKDKTAFPVGSQYVFSGLFQGNTHLINAENLILPATTLASSCYGRMFNDCTSLIAAPELPAMELASYCYWYMFDGCTSLTTAPELPATKSLYRCYDAMFRNCTSLTTAPELPATTLATQCYQNMFSGCTSLTTAPELPATTLYVNCYKYMFYGCTSLTAIPELPATTLANSCYTSMFQNCTSLVQAPELPATTLANACYNFMFGGCTALTQAPALPATTLADRCYNAMFFGCTSLTTAPELPATTLVITGYNSMFKGCSKLNYVKAMFTEVPNANCLGYWLDGVSETGTFVKNSAATWTNEQAEIPTGWTVETASPDK